MINAYYHFAKENPLSSPHHRGGNCVLDKENNNNFVDAYLMFSKAKQWQEGGEWISDSLTRHLVIQEQLLDGRL